MWWNSFHISSWSKCRRSRKKLSNSILVCMFLCFDLENYDFECGWKTRRSWVKQCLFLSEKKHTHFIVWKYEIQNTFIHKLWSYYQSVSHSWPRKNQENKYINITHYSLFLKIFFRSSFYSTFILQRFQLYQNCNFKLN